MLNLSSDTFSVLFMRGKMSTGCARQKWDENNARLSPPTIKIVEY
jgi:hypothetical protein